MPLFCRALRRGVGVVVALAAVVGCTQRGPQVAPVNGIVRIDGRPLEGALLTFQPADGRPSVGVTDAFGAYEMIYTRDQKGARVGEHVVSISTHRKANPDRGTRAVPELLPAKYNHRSELRKMVAPGSNAIDFDLESKGKVVVPVD